MGGLETYVRNLVPALIEARPDWSFSVFANTAGCELLAGEPWAEDVDLITRPLLGRRYMRAISELTYLGWLAPRLGVDLLHSLAMIAPLRTRATSVVTIADVIWLHHDDPGQRPTFLLWRSVVPVVARRADRVITISEAARDEIATGLKLPRDRIDVTHLGCEPAIAPRPTSEAKLRSQFELGGGPIVLAVSAGKVHKNLGRLIEAMRSVVGDFPDARLVVAGSPTAHQGELAGLARRLGLDGAIRFPGWVSDEDLEGLYRSASCFVLPSLREGFGLPVLEAMARGVPVACSGRSALPEVAKDAAIYFDPESAQQIAAAVGTILRDSVVAARLAARGRERQAEFTWKACAAATVASYERAHLEC